MEPLKVLVVDDSAFMRQYITRILESSGKIKVVGYAKNGQEAIEKVQELKPQVMTLDVEMPVMNGLEALKIIMEQFPLPVVMLSSLTTEGAEATIKALELGAVDFVAKPSGQISFDLDKVQEELIIKVSNAALAKLKKTSSSLSLLPQTGAKLTAFQRVSKLVAIGTSTGGPRALQEVVTQFPRNLPAAILIVQHMPRGFTKSLAERLDSISHLVVKEAEDGEEIKNGIVYIAPGDYHMEVRQNQGSYFISLNQSPPVSGHRPSVDVMMKSVARLNLPKIGVIMTGMGGDGSDGMVEIKKSGGKTIAQDESSCVVFGMPKVAIQKGGVDVVVPLNKIALEIMKWL
ncbi:two-component system, chemotaxis family, response regulator CheB [Carboxydocella sporoproducens DSM 16521]|uniref:Protein-glutamate methylesterase/protein-glutamine glutaminase n=2 Tax=Carboxydocella TaxID=178898 RepID=A0A1T4P9S5_9FIRM|nr:MULTISPECIES: chemotaxis response regulator protein-glutamate methylesterase [Carboxydocella]AVX20749.1 two-component system, chemotaxis family, response regulator CheB [Carboxydocella thermautotrophica]AVX31168.1 two-component system, chemotaxis family, response regulator CheB [Carboxydocella thermautotrophica]SJZ87986.1 two-component system, chemotaxis family, response regulator CheB [Carboxydocella sporoproducens DSM 16521]